MILRQMFRPQWLIAAGLFGLALYAIVARAVGSAVLASDSVRGAWTGACLGLELVGLSLVLKSRTRSQADRVG